MSELDPRNDVALNSQPRKPLPRGFVQAVMMKTTAGRSLAERGFRLEFLDIVLPGFVVVFSGLLALMALWLLNQADPYWHLRFQNQLEWLTANIGMEISFPAILIAMAAFLGFITLVGLAVTFSGFSRQIQVNTSNS